MSLRTERLHLIAATPEIMRAHKDGKEALGSVLDAKIEDSLLEPKHIQWELDAFERMDSPEGWLMWYFIAEQDDGARHLVGVGGYKGPPTEDGTVEVGYGIVEAHQRQGYASEATTALVRRAFDDDRVRAVLAETLPSLEASIGVLEKCGFACIGKGSEEGVIRYAFLRSWLG